MIYNLVFRTVASGVRVIDAPARRQKKRKKKERERKKREDFAVVNRKELLDSQVVGQVPRTQFSVIYISRHNRDVISRNLA